MPPLYGWHFFALSGMVVALIALMLSRQIARSDHEKRGRA
jgi:hypothetical protein